jgi:hypothetical protein
MKCFRSIALPVLITALITTACSKTSVENSSPASALKANTAIDMTAKRFGRANLGSSGPMMEFIRPEVRARLDDEPAGDADGGFEPGAAPDSSGSSSGESAPEEPVANEPSGEESYPQSAKLETAKFSWAKKAFGDAVKADVTTNGVIVLYADENYYDLEALTKFVEHGRDMIAQQSGIPGDRLQVAYGGFRSQPEVEFWIVSDNGTMPEFKPEDRTRPSEPEN